MVYLLDSSRNKLICGERILCHLLAPTFKRFNQGGFFAVERLQSISHPQCPLDLNAFVKFAISTADGVQQVTKVARDIIVEARLRADALIKDFDALGLRFSTDPAKTGPDLLLVTAGPRRISLLLSFKAPLSNSADHCSFTVAIYRDWDLLEDVERKVIAQFKFSPNFDRQFKVYWQSTDTDKIFSSAPPC